MPNPLINIGSPANDGTGELGPRGWFDKVNKGLPGPVFNIVGYGAKGDGTTDDTPAIIAAIAAAGVAGGIVLVPSSSTPYVITSTLTLGLPNVALVLQSATLKCTGSVGALAAINVAAAGCSIQGTTYQSSQLQVPVTAAYGINVPAAGTDCLIEKLTISGNNDSSVQHGINAGSTLRLIIRNCHILNFGTHQINTGTNCADWQILDNLIEGSAATFGGILVDSNSSGFQSRGNTILNVGTNAIDLNGSQHRVEANEIRNPGQRGASGVDRYGILCQALTGADVRDNVVVGNRLSGTRNQAIVIRSLAGQNCSRHIIAGNNVIACGVLASLDGIIVDGSSGGTIAENAIVSKVVQGSGRDGIAVDGTGSIVTKLTLVSGNISMDNARYGVYVSGGAGASADNVVVNNHVPGNVSGGVNLNAGGLPTRTTIVGNRENITDTAYEVNAGTLRIGGQANTYKRLDIYKYDQLYGSGVFHTIISGDGGAYGSIDTLAFQPTGGAIFGMGGITGALTAPRVVSTVFVLTDAPIIAVDASKSNYYTVTLAGNRVMGLPTNPINGQRMQFEIIQDGTGGRTLTWNAVFKVSWSDTGNTLNKRSSI